MTQNYSAGQRSGRSQKGVRPFLTKRGLTPFGLQRRPPGITPEAWARLTDFQRRVYAAICRIPPGETRSYQWVAERIGRPRAARAVGHALHRNPFAPTVPCHRVVRADGSLGGYAGGLAKKRELLHAERRRVLARSVA